jgi:hypothetical protein
MAETTADVRRDIELTRERMSSTLNELEQKLNVVQIVRDNPWTALAVAVGAGVLLSGSGADIKAAAVTRGTGSKLGMALDGVVATLMSGVHEAIDHRVNGWVGEVKNAIATPKSHGSLGATERAD